MKKTSFLAILILGIVIAAAAQDPGWPRQITKPGGTLVYYQPQVDSWQNYRVLNWRMAFSLTPTGGKAVLGAITMQGNTVVNTDDHLVQITNLQITNAYFPSLDPATAANMKTLLTTFLPPGVTVSLERVVAYMHKPAEVKGVSLDNTPPTIYVSQRPAILLSVDGQPVLGQIHNTSMKFVVNTHWPLFFDRPNSTYYLFAGQVWMTAPSLEGPWAQTTNLPKDMMKLPSMPEWQGLKNVIPPPQSPNAIVPAVYYSTSPAEMILFNGTPVYTPIPGTQLVYASNTDSPVFVYSPTNQVYFLTAGRWFSSSSLSGPWTYASMSLPADFKNIPPNSPVGGVLASVPGTSEATDAVLISQIPTTITVNPATAAAKASVTYFGAPQFSPIPGTSLSYATNTTSKVIQVNNSYYLCLQGVWFVSTNPQGPWQTATSVPQVIYTIPSSSPVYNVTYVTQTTMSDGNVQSSYTAGYFGAFVVGAAVGAVVASGTGYYYPPYFYYPPMGYPMYYPYAATYGAVPYYNTRTGAYGYAAGAYGPYGGYTRTASYNPYTGTYARTGSVYGPYGSRSAGQAYNPYTGTYAATRQGSSPTAQWGSSVVSRGNQAAYTQHYTTAEGTVGRAETTAGGQAVAGKGAYNSGFAGKSSSGDLYAGKDGNVYRNTGSGWEKYGGDGNWSSAFTPKPTGAQMQGAEQRGAGEPWRAGAGQMQDLQNQSSDRQRGSMQSSRFEGFQRSGGAWGGRFGGGGFGGGGWGGRRR
jgi:hypothetical protein